MIAGVDEVGRGPLAGPVVTAAVILPKDFDLPGLTDSKKLSASKREVLCSAIKNQAIAWSIGESSIKEIDEINILHATMLAMQRAVSALKLKPSHVLVDGNRAPDFGVPATAIVGGDGKEACISAASIVAKVTRDRLMTEYAKEFPQYGWQNNSGYPTKQHIQALNDFGITKYHRLSFGPVARLI